MSVQVLSLVFVKSQFQVPACIRAIPAFLSPSRQIPG